MSHRGVKYIQPRKKGRVCRRKLVTLGMRKASQPCTNHFFKLKGSDSALGLDSVSQVCPHRADLEHAWVTLIRHRVNAFAKNEVSGQPHHNINKALETQIGFVLMIFSK